MRGNGLPDDPAEEDAAEAAAAAAEAALSAALAADAADEDCKSCLWIIPNCKAAASTVPQPLSQTSPCCGLNIMLCVQFAQWVSYRRSHLWH